MLFKIDGISQRSSMVCRLLASKISPLLDTIPAGSQLSGRVWAWTLTHGTSAGTGNHGFIPRIEVG